MKEAQALLEPHHFEFAVTFHEDTSQDHFYLYDIGTFESWLIKKIIAQHVLTVEIPGKILSELKRSIVDALFRFVIAEFYETPFP